MEQRVNVWYDGGIQVSVFYTNLRSGILFMNQYDEIGPLWSRWIN